MKTVKLAARARPGALGQLAQLRQTREQIANSQLVAQERVVQERLLELLAQRRSTERLDQELQVAQRTYDERLQSGDCRVEALQRLSMNLSRRAELFNAASELLVQADARWQEACAEKERLARQLKVASVKLDQANQLRIDSDRAIVRRRDLRQESDAEATPKRGL